jgi:hypothetical protein
MLYVCETGYVVSIIEIYLYVFYPIIHLIFITVIGLFLRIAIQLYMMPESGRKMDGSEFRGIFQKPVKYVQIDIN